MELLKTGPARPPSPIADISHHPVEEIIETRNVAPRERHVESEPQGELPRLEVVVWIS